MESISAADAARIAAVRAAVTRYATAWLAGDRAAIAACYHDEFTLHYGGQNPLAGTHRGHAGLENLLEKANETVETSYPEPPEFLAQGDQVLVIGFATGRIKATNRTFKDHWVFAITVRNSKLTNVREYIDTQALARASEMA